MGQPKAGVEVEGRTMAERAVDALLDGGCREVLIVLGAGAEPLGTRLDAAGGGWGHRVSTVECVQWESGLSASLRTGLASLAARGRGCPVAALVHLVDLPDVGPEVVERVLAQGHEEQAWSRALARAAYDGEAGHPALVGQRHWQGIMDTAQGDRGAGRYLREHRAALVDCSDLADGLDLDTPDQLAAYLEDTVEPGGGGDRGGS